MRDEEKKTQAEWGSAQRRDALLLFEQITGKQVIHNVGGNYRCYTYKAMGGCSPAGMLVNENAIVVVKRPANSAGHRPLLRIGAKQQPWQKAKIKGERQAWLKAHRYAHYEQCQFELMCTAATKCYYISYDPRCVDPGDRIGIVELLPDFNNLKI